MKKISSKLLFVGLIVLFFASCTDVSENDLAPEVTVISPTADTSMVYIGDSIVFDVSLSSENTLSTFRVLSDVSGVDIENGIVDYTSEVNDNVDVTLKITDEVDSGTVIKLSFIVTDQDKQNSTTKYIVAEAKETPLSEADDFTWERVGGNEATGLEMFGLKWTSNSSTSAIIKKDADKFVSLETSDWVEIASKEVLKAKIDAADNIDQFEGVSAEKSETYDIILGTVKDGVYYLIHITSSTVTVDDTVGTTITIIGQYKL